MISKASVSEGDHANFYPATKDNFRLFPTSKMIRVRVGKEDLIRNVTGIL